MKTSIGLYRCPCCGSDVEQELRRLPPFCCGAEMTKVGQHGEHVVVREEIVVAPTVSLRWAKMVGSRMADQESSSGTECRTKQSL